MEYTIRVIRAEAYDNTAMEISMDEESLRLCSRSAVDWDIATVLDALDELFGTGGTLTPYRGVSMGSCGGGLSL
jgi:hypothetical protein